MYKPSTIANYFIIKYAYKEDLTPLKLIKLVYISYGWYLALTDGKKLVSETPEAWNLGPVFPSLYHNLKQFGNRQITEPIVDHGLIPTFDNLHIESTVEKLLNTVWNRYGKYDGITLSSITHTKDTPWSIMYPTGFNAKIPDDIIKEHYNEKLISNRSRETA